jgi:hypothetical protein
VEYATLKIEKYEFQDSEYAEIQDNEIRCQIRQIKKTTGVALNGQTCQARRKDGIAQQERGI